MKMFLPIGVNAIACFLAATALADPPDEKHTIPLDEVWAADMPGTRNVRELEPTRNYVQLPSLETLLRDSLVARIHHALSDRPNEGEKAGPAFIVTGTGKEALRKTADVLTKKAKPAETFPPYTDLTLVFFSYRCGQYVWLDSVERTTNRITVRYRFVSHRTRESTTHFALIPLGKLPRGRVQVEIDQLPPTNIDGDPIFTVPDSQRIVCAPFSFHIRE